MIALWIVWGILTLAVIGLAVGRRIAARKDDELVHLADAEAPAIAQQAALAQKLDWFDTWGKKLTIVDVLFGLVLVSIMLYNAWQESMKMTN